MVEDALYYYLSNKAAVTSLVSTRIYPLKAPQGASYPRITYQEVFGEHVRSLEGSTAAHGYKRIRISSWGQTYTSAKALAEVLRLALDGYRGTWNTTVIHGCLLISEVGDIYHPPQEGSDIGVYQVPFDFDVRFQESIPTL